MMFSKVYVLAIVAFATSTSAHFVDYCECLSHVEQYKKIYIDEYDAYYAAYKEALRKAVGEIGNRLQALPKGGNTCGLSTNPSDYLQNLMALCGGNRLSDSYLPPWTVNPTGTDEEYCRFIVVNCPALEAQTQTMNDLISNCDYMPKFDKSIKTIIDSCVNRCE